MGSEHSGNLPPQKGDTGHCAPHCSPGGIVFAGPGKAGHRPPEEPVTQGHCCVLRAPRGLDCGGCWHAAGSQASVGPAAPVP